MESCTYNKTCKIMEKTYDVIVIGGGTAGSAAAITSAMSGEDTLIIERNSFLGGLASGGQVAPMMNNGIEGKHGRSYIDEIIKKKMALEGYGADDHYGNDGWFNPEMIKYTLEEIFTEYKGTILYNTELIDTVVENNIIKGAIIHNKSGFWVICGKVIIDCTGDADTAFASGVTCFTGDELLHNNQAMSLRFMAGNIDIIKLKAFLKEIGEPDILEYPLVEMASVWEAKTPLNKVFQKGLKDGAIEYPDGKYFQAFSVPGMPGVMSFNCPEIPDVYDTLDTAAVSRGLITGRKMIKRLHGFLKAYIPGFEKSCIIVSAEMPGIRESRRIRGKYILSEKDFSERTKFADGIARTAYPVDIHGLIDEKKLGVKLMERGEYFEIPYRCLVTDSIENLLVAGRCISSTFIAQSSVRIQPTCRALGEAAGIAASFCIRHNRKVNELDGKIVRNIMTEHLQE